MQQIFEMACSLLLLAEVFFVLRYCKKRKMEQALLHQQERFLGEVAVQYTKAADLKESIHAGISQEDSLMEKEAYQLLDSLENDKIENVMDYLSQVKNSFFAVFYAMCHAVQNLGDIYQKGQSLFVKNIQYIEEEVRMEILRLQNAGYLFRGLMGLCVLPYFFIPLIQIWVLSIESGMGDYYGGSYGIGTTLVCFFVSGLSLLSVLWLHFPDFQAKRQYSLEIWLLRLPVVGFSIDRKMERNYSKFLKKNEELKKLQGFGNIRQFLVRKYLCMAMGMIFVSLLILLAQSAGRAQLYREVTVPSVWTVELDEEEKALLRGKLAETFRQMVDGDWEEAELDSGKWGMYSEQIRQACKELLARQKRAYDRIRFSWLQLILIFAGGSVGFLLPELELGISRWNVEQKKMEETLRFQTMILVLRNYPQMTVEELLKWLESFAELFRQAFAQAADSFSYDRKAALVKLREDAGFEPVGRIADALGSCDEVLIADAFFNMESERNYYMDQYKQKVEAWTRERAALAKAIAYLPFLSILALKLIVPFVMQGISQLGMYRDSFATMM